MTTNTFTLKDSLALDRDSALSRRFVLGFFIFWWSILGLMALGAGVRAMNAGLACPDWPLCFGDFIPDYHPEVYFEFLHRAYAGLISLALLYFNVRILRSGIGGKPMRRLIIFSFLLLSLQVVMGGLTVLLILKDYVVMTHLTLGTALFLTVGWMNWSLRANLGMYKKDKAFNSTLSGPTLKKIKIATLTLFVVLVLQVLLGAKVAATYAANVCPTFPLCHGQWFPTFFGQIGAQVLHRLGAYITLLSVVGFYLALRWSGYSGRLRTYARILVSLVLVQFVLGIANVLFGTPPIITVLHLAVAGLIVATGLWQAFLARLA